MLACGDDPISPAHQDKTPPIVDAITSTDANHFEIRFSEEVTSLSAQDWDHIVVVESGARRAMESPGDPIHLLALVLGPDNRTLYVTTSSSTAGLVIELSIAGVEDSHGNTITTPVTRSFTGSTSPDVSPPQLFRRTPAPHAENLLIGTVVTFQFSEPVDLPSVYSGLTWTSSRGPVEFDLDNGTVWYTLWPPGLLEYGETYTVSLLGVKDKAGNVLADTEWTFATTSQVDNTPPTIVSTSPAHLARNVNVNTEFSVTFSEPMNPRGSHIDGDPFFRGYPAWSDDGRTVTYKYSWEDLEENQQYTVTVEPGDVFDMSGNTVQDPRVVIFTTGDQMEAGSLAGRIEGHWGTAAAYPAGARVFAIPTFGNSERIGTVGTNNTYKISFLEDDLYEIIAVLDTNHDGYYVPLAGDAVGGYGADLSAGDSQLAYVAVWDDKYRTGLDFPLFDASAVFGTLAYNGVCSDCDSVAVHIGLFDTRDYDLSTSLPVATNVIRLRYQTEFLFHSFIQSIPDGEYYLAAFMDLNGTDSYEPAVDPAGMYTSDGSPIAVHISKGSDILDTSISLSDPVMVKSSSSVRWPAPKRNTGFERLASLVARSQGTKGKRAAFP